LTFEEKLFYTFKIIHRKENKPIALSENSHPRNEESVHREAQVRYRHLTGMDGCGRSMGTQGVCRPRKHRDGNRIRA
jgi:hypothetical protein